MRVLFLLLSTLVVFSTAEDTAEDDTTHTSNKECSPAETWSAELNAVDIEDCIEGERCNLVKGSNKRINLTITPKNEISSLHARVHGIVADFPVPFAVPQENACENSGIECPLKPNNKVTYTAVLPVKTIYPQISLQVKWELVDESDKVVACKMIPVKIVKSHK